MDAYKVRRLTFDGGELRFDEVLRKGSLFAARLHDDERRNILLVQFSTSSPASRQEEGIQEQLRSQAVARIPCNGQTVLYSFLGHSNSQLRSRACFLYRGHTEVVRQLLERCGNFFSQEMTIATCAKRIGQLFTECEYIINLIPKGCRYQDSDNGLLVDVSDRLADIETDDRYNFTDGCGAVSTDVAEEFAWRTRPSEFRGRRCPEPIPSVFQVRFGGYKGVLVVDDRLDPGTIRFRDSMCKFTTPDGLDRASPFGVVRFSRPLAYGYLNAQIVMILSHLGIKDEVFDRLSGDPLEDLALQLLQNGGFPVLRSVMTDPVAAVRPVLDCLGSGRSPAIGLAGARLRVEDSRLLFGVADLRMDLQEGQCYLQVQFPDRDGPPQVITGPVLVTRNPCYLPGDVRVLTAVDVPYLRHLSECIVFPVRGRRPHADEMTGGDQDGDLFFVTWQKDLIPAPVLQLVDYRHKDDKNKKVFADRPQERVEYFLNHFSRLGEIDSLFLKHAESRGIDSDECKSLALLFSRAVDNRPDDQYKIWQLKANSPRPSSQKPIWQRMFQDRHVDGTLLTELAARLGNPAFLDGLLQSPILRDVSLLHEIAAWAPDNLPLSLTRLLQNSLQEPPEGAATEGHDSLGTTAALVPPCAEAARLIDEFRTTASEVAGERLRERDELNAHVVEIAAPIVQLDRTITGLAEERAVARRAVAEAVEDQSRLRRAVMRSTDEFHRLTAAVKDLEARHEERKTERDSLLLNLRFQFGKFKSLLTNKPNKVELEMLAVREEVRKLAKMIDIKRAERRDAEIEAGKAQAEATAATVLLVDALTNAKQIDERLRQLHFTRAEQASPLLAETKEKLRFCQAAIDELLERCPLRMAAAARFLETLDLSSAQFEGEMRKTLRAMERREVNQFRGKLPVYSAKQNILAAIEKHSAVILNAGTGSGKTTQVVQYLLDCAWSWSLSKICLAQPRRLATTLTGSRVCKELELGREDSTSPEGGDLVGYHIGGDRKVGANARVVFMTNGILMNALLEKSHLPDFSVVILDEAHERSTDFDCILALLKQTLAVRKDLRVVVASASIDAGRFSAYLDYCPVIKVNGQPHAVTTHYCPPFNTPRNPWESYADKAIEIHQCADQGDILVFLATKRDVRQACDYTRRKAIDALVLGLHGRTASNEREKCTSPCPPISRRKIIFSTNVAETSVTLDGITVVVDSGVVNVVTRDPATLRCRQEIRNVSQGSSDQRKGRAGRTRPGECYRMFSKDDFDNRPRNKEPDIITSPLDRWVLRVAKSYQLFSTLDFIDKPQPEHIQAAQSRLSLISFINADGALTDDGLVASQLPLDDPRLCRVLIAAAREHKCGWEVAVVLSMLSTEWTGRNDKSINNGIEYATLLREFIRWQEQDDRRDKTKPSMSEDGDSADLLFEDAVYEGARDLLAKIQRAVNRCGMKLQREQPSAMSLEQRVARAFFSAYADAVCHHLSGSGYHQIKFSTQGQMGEMQLVSTSKNDRMPATSADAILCHEFEERKTRKALFAKAFCTVDPVWL